MIIAPWVNRYRVRLLRTQTRPLLQPLQEPARPQLSPERQLILRALRELAGCERTLIYDVPRSEAPEPLPGTPVYLRGSASWRYYLRDRRELDEGELTLLLALRPLSEVERLLVTDWGSTYANTFLLLEPSDPSCDLTDPTNAAYRSLEQAARALLERHAPDAEPGVPWTRGTRLGSILRVLYGTWVYWSGTYSSRRSHHLVLAPSRPSDTLAGLLLPQLPERFPQAAFDRALAELYAEESELFHSAVTSARMPFRTRLGLPVLHDPAYADRALRTLVNEGHARVYRLVEDTLQRYGAGRPIPDSMSEAEFARLLL